VHVLISPDGMIRATVDPAARSAAMPRDGRAAWRDVREGETVA
jgi:hypothetical protein